MIGQRCEGLLPIGRNETRAKINRQIYKRGRDYFVFKNQSPAKPHLLRAAASPPTELIKTQFLVFFDAPSQEVLHFCLQEPLIPFFFKLLLEFRQRLYSCQLRMKRRKIDAVHSSDIRVFKTLLPKAAEI